MKTSHNFLLLLSIPLFMLFFLAFCNINNVAAKASRNTNENVSNDYQLTNKMKKQGYSYSLNPGNHEYILPNLSKNKYKKVIKNKVKFQVRRITTYKNSITAKLVSKNGKYKVYADYVGDFYYTNSRNKSLKPIVKLMKKIDLNNNKYNKTNLKKLDKMISKLKNRKDKSVAKMSFQQLKKSFKDDSILNTPCLLLGNI